ncbi:restriction endonuclease [Streptomyces xiamenensis]|uniref:Restriction endonuclease n=1 Tax=Streptomyces xiamenensis TaxID=408015 RepID=A0A0F7CNZ2_9ACTN|nr:restriction endonuclease [Streptomyces xiamenensis]AKG43756.1 restriction endonuclease [Streptomyces xiamenensis]
MGGKRQNQRNRRKRQVRRNRWGATGIAVVAAVVIFWPYTLIALGAAALGALGWWLWRRDRRARAADREFRAADRRARARATVAALDILSWREFEEHVAWLCRRDGCGQVEVTGRAGDLGADVTALLPDGRRLVVQCKQYRADRSVGSADMQKFLGTVYQHHRADLAVFVTTAGAFTRQALELATQQRVLAIHRDYLGLWNSGTPLLDLIAVNGAGQGRRERRKGG